MMFLIEHGWPFIGLLLSLALMPSLCANVWHKWYAVIINIWTLCGIFLIFKTLCNPEQVIFTTLTHDYIPFILLMGTLYVLADHVHILIRQNAHATPWMNTAFLGCGMLASNILGTTGVSMILIRPFLKLNHARKFKKHSLVFFIFLISNIGGSLTPLGDPPLMMGFLKGIPFFWTVQTLWAPFCVISGILLVLYFLCDLWLYKSEKIPLSCSSIIKPIYGIRGMQDVFIFAISFGGIIFFQTLYPEMKIQKWHSVYYADWMRIIVFASMLMFFTAKQKYKKPFDLHNEVSHFSWTPFYEIVFVFLSVFMTSIPIFYVLTQENFMKMLQSFVHDPAHIFWYSGTLSATLDNAPTYLLFFNIIGENAASLMQNAPKKLMALSMGSVYMGALTYIGNAPNIMVATLARQKGIQIPSFFEYILWSCLILLPVFLMVSWMFL